MAASDGHRRGGLALLLLAVLALELAGCTRSPGPAPTPPPTPTTTPSPSLTPVDASQPQPFPSTPQEYAELTVAAWAAPDLIRLGELTTPAVRDELVELPGPPNPSWSFIGCQTGADSSECAFYNQDGDQLVLTVDHAGLGGPRATIATAFEATEYPADVEAYLAEFIAAWQAGNLARMANLAVATVVEALSGSAPPAGAEPSFEVGETTNGLVAVTVTIDGQRVDTRLTVALLGDQHAIRAATLVE
ncbi:MAG TPA: hypothetical protein VIL37_14910 [Natronosporangium sp.]